MRQGLGFRYLLDMMPRIWAAALALDHMNSCNRKPSAGGDSLTISDSLMRLLVTDLPKKTEASSELFPFGWAFSSALHHCYRRIFFLKISSRSMVSKCDAVSDVDSPWACPFLFRAFISLFISDQGSLYACGWIADGQTGLGHYDNASRVAQCVGDVRGVNVVKVACGADCVLALSGKTKAYRHLNTKNWFEDSYVNAFGGIESHLWTCCHLPLHGGWIRN